MKNLKKIPDVVPQHQVVRLHSFGSSIPGSIPGFNQIDVSVSNNNKSFNDCQTSFLQSLQSTDDVDYDFSDNLDLIGDELNARFLPKKDQSNFLADVYDILDLPMRASLVRDCGSFLEFSIFSDNSHRLTGANFCKDRLCPMCNWRRSLKIFGQVSAIMDELERQSFQFLFLTLTIKNCSRSDLPKTIDVLINGFTKLFNRKMSINLPIRKSIKGFFRSLEITKNQNTGEYHPHLHCIVAVKPDYFKGSNYIKAIEWSRIWRSCIDSDYNPIIDIRRIKNQNNGSYSASREVAKYSVKRADFLNPSDIDESVSTVSDFLKALSFRRLISFTGVFADVRRLLRLEDDIEDGNLVVTDIDEKLRSDVAVAVFRFCYRCGCYTLLN